MSYSNLGKGLTISVPIAVRAGVQATRFMVERFGGFGDSGCHFRYPQTLHPKDL